MQIHQPGGHFDQLLRQTRWHHVQLSAMADVKANMMLTVPAVLMTLVVPRLTEPAFRWAALTLIGFCLLTIVLAAYAAMPDRMGSARKSDNILFFNDFIRMPYGEFATTMEAILNDPARTYEAQVREIYTLGTYLARKKYRFLRYAYLSFTVGLLASAGVFAVNGVL